VSGVHRGEQRQSYDRRRDELIPRHGLRLWVIQPDDVGGNARGRLDRRDHDRDLQLLGRAWSEPVILAAARAYQARTAWHTLTPPTAT